MVVIHKNWQALPVSATTVTAPNIEDHAWPPPVSTYTPPPDSIQQPTAHLSSEPDIVELHEINQQVDGQPLNFGSGYFSSSNVGQNVFLIPDWTYFHYPGATLLQDRSNLVVMFVPK